MTQIRPEKLSHHLANTIAREIIINEYPENHMLGKESALLKSYGVSRDTFREAVRVLEWQGLVRTIPGPTGGLCVSKPSSTAIVNIIRDFLDLTNITFDEVMELRLLIEPLAVKLATANIRDDAIESLRISAQERRERHDSRTTEILKLLNTMEIIYEASNNPALSLLIKPLSYVAIDFIDIKEISETMLVHLGQKSWRIIKSLVESIIGNDDINAEKEVNAYLKIIRESFKPSLNNNSLHILYPQWYEIGENKLARSLIYRIKQEIVEKKLSSGERLGSEVELIEYYHVSRSIFREASRILELLGITQNTKGRNGGLVVGDQNSYNVVSAVAQFFETIDLNFDNIHEVRSALDGFVVGQAAKKRTKHDVSEMHSALRKEAQVSGEHFFDALADTHNLFCKIAGNRVASLYIAILIKTSIFRPIYETQIQKIENNRALITRSHSRIVQAIEAKDQDLAQQRMFEHRNLMAKYLRL
jgi:DNA-binding FadR family transcriptional regulator